MPATEALTDRERRVIEAMRRYAVTHGSWPSIRQLGQFIALDEGRESLSVASTVRNLKNKGQLKKMGRNFRPAGVVMRVSVKLVNDTT